MQKRELEVQSRLGIHGRPAALLVKTAREHPESRVTLLKGESRADAGSINSVIALGINRGDRITIEVVGGEEVALLAALTSLLEASGEGARSC